MASAALDLSAAAQVLRSGEPKEFVFIILLIQRATDSLTDVEKQVCWLPAQTVHKCGCSSGVTLSV